MTTIRSRSTLASYRRTTVPARVPVEFVVRSKDVNHDFEADRRRGAGRAVRDRALDDAGLLSPDRWRPENDRCHDDGSRQQEADDHGRFPASAVGASTCRSDRRACAIARSTSSSPGAGRPSSSEISDAARIKSASLSSR